MSYPQDEIEELKKYGSGLAVIEEGGCTYFLLRDLQLPSGCIPTTCDALLCPTPHTGYPSRVFYSERVKCNGQPNWNATGVRIAERNWDAFSWNVSRTALRLAEILAAHLRGLA